MCVNVGRGEGRGVHIFIRLGLSLKRGKSKSTKNRLACVKGLMRVEEVREVCQDRIKCRSMISAYPNGRHPWCYECMYDNTFTIIHAQNNIHIQPSIFDNSWILCLFLILETLFTPRQTTPKRVNKIPIETHHFIHKTCTNIPRKWMFRKYFIKETLWETK